MAENFADLCERPDPPEYQLPSHPDQVFENGSTRFVVRTFLHDPYQSGLVDSGWLELLVAELYTYPELNDKSICLVVRPRFNKAVLDSDWGYAVGSRSDEENPHKNKFLLEASWVLPSGAPMQVGYSYEVLSQHNGFQLLSCDNRYEWSRPPGETGDLEAVLLELGILREVTLETGVPDTALTRLSMMGVDELPSLVPLNQSKHVLTVAIDVIETFPDDLKSSWGWTGTRVLDPVVVRNRDSVLAFRELLYEGLVVKRRAFLEGFRASSRLDEVGKAEFERASEELRAGDHFSLVYFNSWAGRVEVLLGPVLGLARSTLRCKKPEYPGSDALLLGNTRRGSWEGLQAAAKDEQVWRPVPERAVIDGASWSLTRVGQDGRKVTGWVPEACAFLEFCFQLMEEAGLELDVRRFVSWRRSGEER